MFFKNYYVYQRGSVSAVVRGPVRALELYILFQTKSNRNNISIYKIAKIVSYIITLHNAYKNKKDIFSHEQHFFFATKKEQSFFVHLS